MDKDLLKYYQALKKKGLTREQENRMLYELFLKGGHDMPVVEKKPGIISSRHASLYADNDLAALQKKEVSSKIGYTAGLKSLDELMERDKQREEDGFPRKIQIGKLVRPDRTGKDHVVIVPTTIEEKFIHDPNFDQDDEDQMGGSGDGEEGEVIGEQPVRAPDMPGAEGSGEGDGAAHELESSAYDLGKILTEQFQLPNLMDKGKKRSLTRYTYDMTDRHRGFGQILDKKATLKKIVETNISLGNLPDISDIDPSRFLIAPSDMIYRILSREKDYESQAVVFFLRDYSGSMSGKPTTLVVAQHVMIYSWLLYQYAMQVETRFILHDTDAKEVPNFYTYYNSKVAGGTKVASAYRMVNEIVEKENLAQDNNIYVFHGTDGDDWDTEGKETIPEIKKMMNYVSRVGVTIAEHRYGAKRESEVEKYLKKSKLLEEQPKYIRLDVVQEDADEPRLIEGIKHLISQ